MNYDYTIVSKKNDGTTVKRFGYQNLIRLLGIEKEIINFQPASSGGLPQVQTVINMLMSAKPAGVDYIVAEYQGEAVLSTQTVTA